MKDHHLINFNLFCLRKNFNLHLFLKSNNKITYEEFCSFLRERKVFPPSKIFFDETLNKTNQELDIKKVIIEPVQNKKVKTTKKHKRKKKTKNEQS
tara:strand:- start:2154 stop:2441 length:288 start_codon:yes stop_codon:yes gene_type:complete